MQDISYLTAFLILVVASALRVIGDVALHSHVRALLYEAVLYKAEQAVAAEEAREQMSKELDALHVMDEDSTNITTIDSKPPIVRRASFLSKKVSTYGVPVPDSFDQLVKPSSQHGPASKSPSESESLSKCVQ